MKDDTKGHFISSPERLSRRDCEFETLDFSVSVNRVDAKCTQSAAKVSHHVSNLKGIYDYYVRSVNTDGNNSLVY
jgi:hypothetical protein